MNDFFPEIGGFDPLQDQQKQAQYMHEYSRALAKLTKEFLESREDIHPQVVFFGVMFNHIVGMYQEMADDPTLEHLAEGLSLAWHHNQGFDFLEEEE